MNEEEILINEDDTLGTRLSCIAKTIKDWVYRHAIPINHYNHLVAEIDAIVEQIKEIHEIIENLDEYLYSYGQEEWDEEDIRDKLGKIKERTKVE